MADDRRGTSIGREERHRRRIRKIFEENRELFDALATDREDE